MVIDLINNIMAEVFISAEWEPTTHYNEKGDVLGRTNYRRMELKGENMKKVERVIENLIRK